MIVNLLALANARPTAHPCAIVDSTVRRFASAPEQSSSMPLHAMSRAPGRIAGLPSSQSCGETARRAPSRR